MSQDEKNDSTQGETPNEDSHPLRRDDPRDSDQEEEKSGGIEGYESEREPGERVRTARMTDDVPSSQRKKVDPEQAGRAKEVDVAAQKQQESEEAAEADSSGSDGGSGADEAATMEDLTGGGGDGSATTEDFAAIFAQSGGQVPGTRDYSTGDRVKGEIIEIGDRDAFIQLDVQTEGSIARRELENDDRELQHEVGDVLEFYVTGVTEDEIKLGQEMGGQQGSLDAIRDAHESGVPVKGTVTGTNKGGFEVEIHGVDAFCPISGIELAYTEEKEVHVGATYRFKVTEVKDGGRSVVVNRADLLREERAEKAKETLENLEAGQVVEGVVTRLADFGAFIDLGGVEGLCHVTELSHRTFDNPGDVVAEGETLDVEVLEIEEPDKPGGDPRISLSRKATESDPWEQVNEQFAVGENVEGTVVRNAPFGSFVEIAPGVEGLVHVSEMSWTEHVRTPSDICEPGDKVLVQIQDIDIAKRRISLSIKGAEGDPWDDAAEQYAEGMEVTGTVENNEDFGTFVKLPSGITALIPRSEMELPNGVTPHRKYKEGEEVTADVLNVDPGERKMALTTKGRQEGSKPKPDDGEGDSQQTSSRSSSQDDGFGGTLGDMIGDDLTGD